MDCQKCGMRKGQIQVKRLIEGSLQEMLLCDECLRSETERDQNSPFVANHMLTVILDAVGQSALQVNLIKTTSCSQCGMTFGVYREIGKMGCSKCYQTFADRLEPVLNNWHGHSKHVGKDLAYAPQIMARKSEIQKLNKALKEAISVEAFEEAALLRDQILALEMRVTKNE